VLQESVAIEDIKSDVTYWRELDRESEPDLTPAEEP
jgi:hypothetical protein